MSSSKKVTPNTMSNVFFFLVFAISSVATYGFMSTFVADFIPSQFFGSYHAMISGFVGWLLMDFSAFMWHYIRINVEGLSKDQMEIAQEMSYVTIGAAIIITVVYMLLSGFSLVNDPAVRMVAGTAGMLTVVAVFGWSFFRVFCFIQANPDVHRKEQLADIRATEVDDVTNAVLERLRATQANRINRIANDMEHDVEEELGRAARGGRAAPTTMPQPQQYSLPPVNTPQLGAADNGYMVVGVVNNHMNFTKQLYTSLIDAWEAVYEQMEHNTTGKYFVMDTLTGRLVDQQGNPIEVDMSYAEGNGHAPTF